MLNESVASFYAYHASEVSRPWKDCKYTLTSLKTPQHQSDRSSSGTQAPSSSASSSIDAATAIVHAHAAKIKLERDDNLPSQQIDQKPAQTPKKKASTAVTPKQLQTLRRHYRRSYDRNASDADRQNERDRVAQIVGVTPTVVSVSI